MRKLVVLGLALFLVGAAATAMPLCDYNYLDTDISNLEVSFSYDYHKDPYNLQDISSGQLKIDYTRLFDSPRFGFDISGKNDMTVSGFNLSSVLTRIRGNIKYYFSADAPYFGFAGADGKISSAYQGPGLEIKGGLGCGRLKDVTPLAMAVRIDAYLVKEGVISEHLHDENIKAIAYEIANITTTYDDSVAELLKVIQEIIETNGSLKIEGFDRHDIYEMEKIIENESYLRYCGGDIKLGIGYEIFDPLAGPRDFLLTTAFNFAFTSTPWAQFLCQGTLSGSYNILQTHRMEIGLSYDYILSETLDFSSSYSFSREVQEGIPADTHNLSLNLVWTPSEKTHLTLGIRFGHEPDYLEWSADITLFVGIDLL